MSKLNHRRKNKPPVDRRYPEDQYENGYTRSEGQSTMIRVGGTGFLDKSMHGWGGMAPISNKRFGAGIGNDFTDGHRGMAKAVRGAKKFVRTRVRFHENAETRKLAQSVENEESR